MDPLAVLTFVLLGLSVSGSLAALTPVQHIELHNNSSLTQPELRQYTCGTSSPVYVALGYQGRFASPNYPNFYNPGSDCLWSLTTAVDVQLTLICDPLVISCTGDYLIYSLSGDTLFRDAPQAICGSGRLQVTSKTNSIAIAFHSSLYTSGGGFSCVVQALQAQPTTTTASPATTTTTKPPTCTCGIKGQNRVVGGANAGITEYPWQTLLADLSGGGYQYCAGALIAQNWVVTAAHCTQGRTAASIGIVVGQYNTVNLTSTSQVRKVKQIIQHPNFNRTTVNNDIALLQLDSPVRYSGAVQPICLPKRFVNFDLNGKKGEVTGWGTTSFGGSASKVLQKVTLTMLSTTACKTYPSVAAKITDNMICTYTENKDACQGDSGGPLNFVDPVTGQVYLVGIISWGIGCAKLDTPGVYTKVTNYLSWIEQYTGTLCSA